MRIKIISDITASLLITDGADLPLSQPLIKFSVAQDATAGCIYVTGGSSNKISKGQAYRYQIRSSVWTELPSSMNYSRQDHSSLVIGDKLAVVGGFSQMAFLSSVEILDLQND